MGFIKYDVNRYTPRQMVVIPLVLLILSLAVLGYTMATTGMPVTPGMDFSGGTAVTLFTSDSADSLSATFSGYPLISIGEGVNNGKYLKFGPMDDDSLQSLATLINERYPDAKIDQIGASFGRNSPEPGCHCPCFVVHRDGNRGIPCIPDLCAFRLQSCSLRLPISL